LKKAGWIILLHYLDFPGASGDSPGPWSACGRPRPVDQTQGLKIPLEFEACVIRDPSFARRRLNLGGSFGIELVEGFGRKDERRFRTVSVLQGKPLVFFDPLHVITC
jgi:hypothetical protein